MKQAKMITFKFTIRYFTQIYSRFFSYADPSEKFQFSNRYNFCSDELFRIKSTKISVLSGVLLLLAHKKSLRPTCQNVKLTY
jgi:hypothetical protein